MKKVVLISSTCCLILFLIGCTTTNVYNTSIHTIIDDSIPSRYVNKTVTVNGTYKMGGIFEWWNNVEYGLGVRIQPNAERPPQLVYDQNYSFTGILRLSEAHSVYYLEVNKIEIHSD
jgi:hypothetical protein